MKLNLFTLLTNKLKAKKQYNNFKHKCTQNTNKTIFNLKNYNPKFNYRKYGFSLYSCYTYNLNKKNYKYYLNDIDEHMPRFNKNKYFVLCDDKFVFYSFFRNFIPTAEVFAVIKNGNLIFSNDKMNFYKSIIKHNGCVIKPRFGNNGKNIFKISAENNHLIYKGTILSNIELEKLILSLKGDYVIQEIIMQNQFENSLYTNSLNTIRVISMNINNKIEIGGALQRIGTKRSFNVDNFSQGGLSCLIDIETGILTSGTCADSFDKNGNRIFYEKHPDTGNKLKGVSIPNWKGVVKFIKDAHKSIGFYKFIAWDLALTNNGICVVEMNLESGLHIFQVHKPLKGERLGFLYQTIGFYK